MAIAILVVLVLILTCFGIASAVFNKRQKAGKEPWGWAIGAFLISAAVIILGLSALFMYAFSFER